MNASHSSSSPTFQPVLTRNIHRPGSERISTYLDHGGYQAVRKALVMKPEEIIKQIKQSGLRGRGGAGFPTGKLSSRTLTRLSKVCLSRLLRWVLPGLMFTYAENFSWV